MKYEDLSQDKVLTEEEAVDRVTHLLNEFWPDALSHITANMCQVSMLYGALGVIFYDESMKDTPFKASVLLTAVEDFTGETQKIIKDFLQSVDEIRRLISLKVETKPDGEQVQ